MQRLLRYIRFVFFQSGVVRCQKSQSNDEMGFLRGTILPRFTYDNFRRQFHSNWKLSVLRKLFHIPKNTSIGVKWKKLAWFFFAFLLVKFHFFSRLGGSFGVLCINGWYQNRDIVKSWGRCVWDDHNYRIGWASAAFGRLLGLLYTHASDTYSCIPSEATTREYNIIFH